MRCHFSDADNNDEGTHLPAYNIWTSGTLQTPNILKSILNPIGHDDASFSEDLTNLCSLDSISPSYKRKIDCEKEDIGERFHKIQRKKQLQKVAARANLVVDDYDDSDEEDKIYQQMDWLEKENAMNLHTFDSSSSSSDEDDLFDNHRSGSSVVLIPRFKWKDERRRLLRISMAKIQGVEDPEAYLRRSVLINNTVKRLQNDVAMNCTTSSSFFQGNISFQNNSLNSWDVGEICKHQFHAGSFGFEYEYDVIDLKKHTQAYCDVPCSLKFHLACAAFSSSQSLDVPQRDLNDPTYCSSPYEEQQRPNIPLPSLVIKPPSGLHVFSSQPCGLQYRNPLHVEDTRDEYRESPTSSILDSVVYHSLVTSLET